MKKNTFLTLKDLDKYNSYDCINSIWFAIMRMETELLEILLYDDINYEDIGKQAFIKKLNDHFDYHASLGDSQFLLDLDYCNSCNCGKPICKFIGNHSRKHFALYFEIDNGDIIDIYHCNWYGDDDFLDTF